MPNVIDPDARLALLELISQSYPDMVPAKNLGIEDNNLLRGTLHYMEEKGLLDVQWISSLQGKSPMGARLTARGYDVVESSSLPDLSDD